MLTVISCTCLTPQTNVILTVVVQPRVLTYLVVLEHCELDLLPLVLVLLGGGVGLLLPFFGTTTQPQHQVQSGLL